MEPRSRVSILALVFLFAFAFAPLLACAEPGYGTTIPAPVFVAGMGGDVSALPADCPPVESWSKWYDRQVGFDVEGRHADGRTFSMRYTGASDAANALEARRSDNDRATSQLRDTLGLLKDFGLLAARTQGLSIPSEGATASPATEARLDALEAKLDELAAAIAALSKAASGSASVTPGPASEADPSPPSEGAPSDG